MTPPGPSENSTAWISKAALSSLTRRARKNPVGVGIVPVTGEDFLADVLATVDDGIISCFESSRGLPAARKVISKGERLSIFDAGQYVRHLQYGCGVIVRQDSERTIIDFDNHGIKIFVTSLISIEATEGVPPKRRRTKRTKAMARSGAPAILSGAK
jgi:hypothetical protein